MGIKIKIMVNYIKKNSIVIGYILTIISDTVFKFTEDLDLTSNQLIYLKAIGAIVAVISAQHQAILNENKNG